MIEYKEIDGEVYKIEKVERNELIIKELLEMTEEYEKLKKEIYSLETEIFEKEKELGSMEFQINYNIRTIEKDNFTNETQRELELKKRLKDNEIYRDLMQIKFTNLDGIKIRRSRLEALEFKSKIFRAIITEKRDY